MVELMGNYSSVKIVLSRITHTQIIPIEFIMIKCNCFTHQIFKFTYMPVPKTQFRELMLSSSVFQ